MDLLVDQRLLNRFILDSRFKNNTEATELNNYLTQFKQEKLIRMIYENQTISSNNTSNQLNTVELPKPIKTKVKSAVKLGQMGEKYIQEYLTKLGYIYTNTTKTAHVGDGHIEFEQFIVLFEIKNKNQLTQNDYTKFRSDILYLQNEKSKFVYGIFISLQHKIQIQFNFKEVYITWNELNLLDWYIQVLIKLNYDNTVILKRLENEMNNYNRELELCTKQLTNIKQMKLDIQELTSLLTQKSNVLYNIINEIDDDFNGITTTKTELTKYIKSNSKWTLKQCNVILGIYKNYPGIRDKLKSKPKLLKWLGIE